MKVTAFLQPLTHKLCNKLFHETDPIPQAMPEETAEGRSGSPGRMENGQRNNRINNKEVKQWNMEFCYPVPTISTL